jgi:hypothetical protein
MSHDLIAKKKAEIANYERILLEYRSGRWLNSGRCHLADLKAQLLALEQAALNPPVAPAPDKVD